MPAVSGLGFLAVGKQASALPFLCCVDHVSRRHPAAPCALENLPCIAHTDPFIPVVKMRRLWARLSTHVPTEPAVTGGEHTAAGFSAAGLLLWLSPWQVCSSDVTLMHVCLLPGTGFLLCVSGCQHPAAGGGKKKHIFTALVQPLDERFVALRCYSCWKSGLLLLFCLQVKLLLAAIDQLAADGLAMSSRLRQRAGGADATTADVVRAAGQAAGAAAAQIALEQGQEAGSAPAAAAKAATVLLEAAGVMAPGAQLQELEGSTAANSTALGVPGTGRHSRQPSAGQSQQQEQQQRRRQLEQGDEGVRQRAQQAHEASRVAAELSSMQILVVLPYAEVLCFADVGDSSSSAGITGSSDGHRWEVENRPMHAEAGAVCSTMPSLFTNCGQAQQ